MPNGTNLSPDELNVVSKPLINVEGVVKGFAEIIGGTYVQNYHGPEARIIIRGPDDLQKMITLSPIILGQGASKERPKYSLAIWAHQDTETTRNWFVENVALLSMESMTQENVAQLLSVAWKRLKDINLEFVLKNGRSSTSPEIRMSDFENTDTN